MNALNDPSQTLQDLIHVIAGDNRQTSTQTDSDESFPFAVQNRDLVSRCSIAADTPLLTIAREHQLWNTDALADPFIQQHLFTAKHAQSQKLVDHRAYFAAYVALRVAKLKKQTNQRQGDNLPSTQDLYLSYLPTAQEYAYHPVLQKLDDLAETFDPRHSVTYALIQRRQVEWKSEYAAFCTESPNDFAQTISQSDYLVARINLSSRAFTAGHDWTVLMRHDISCHIQRADLDLYERYIDYNVQRDGMQVLVPVLDAHNHHPAANVEFDFDAQTLAFQFSAARDIPADTELFINYGGRVDPWFYATYGFVNADGSGLPGLSLAVLHTMYNERVEIPLPNDVEDDSNSATQWETYQRNLGQPAQRQDLQKYLTSASSCIQNVQHKLEEPCHDKFCEWKLEALQTIANDPSHWIVALPPLNPQAPLPKKSTNPYPKYKIQPETTTTTKTTNRNQILTMYEGEVVDPLPVTLPRMIETALSTCRLLAFAEHDNFDEHKAQLPWVISAPPPLPPRTRATSAPVVPDLETRAHLVLLRLVNLALADYQCGSSLHSLEGRGQGDDHSVIQPAVVLLLLRLLASECYGLRLTRAYAQKYLGLTT